MNTSETITYKPATQLPDSDVTVLLFDKAASEPVWPGYHDGDRWLYIDGVVATPTAWADMPEGPHNQGATS